jgi:hypothetical protein
MKRKKVVLAVSATILSLVVIYANPSLAKSVMTAFTPARAIPISSKLVKLTFLTPTGKPVDVTQKEGGLVRISFQGRTYGLASKILDEQTGAVKVRLAAITTVFKDGIAVGEAVDVLDDIELSAWGNPVSFSGKSGLPLVVVGVEIESDEKKTEAETPAVVHQSDYSPMGNECCVTCDGLTFCGCKVSVPGCGGCCMESCC